ncbi:MAG: hypothetical protein J0I29_08645 [Rhizobiales bacterium]|nr:hypothetical protein [Hyphomicrobiales bacterium]
MTEEELKLHYLTKFYERRGEDRPVSLIDDSAGDEVICEYSRISRQLSESGLIEWCPIMGLPIGFGKISNLGIRAIENRS